MSRPDSSPLGDIASAAVVVVAAMGELLLREAYYRIGSELSGAVLLVSAGAPATLLLLGVGGLYPRARTLSARLLLLVAVALALRVAVVPSLELGASGFVTAVSGVAVVGLVLCCPQNVWVRCRTAVAAAAVVFLCSQLTLAKALAPAVVWPPASAITNNGITLVMLFDELNAREAPAFESVFAKHGMSWKSRAIDTIGQRTREVIPAMITGFAFEKAKPCALSAVCSPSSVLDFLRIKPGGPNVDIVGFYHPYCDIPHLRYCRRIGLQYRWDDSQTWRCAIWHRLEWDAAARASACARMHIRNWEGIRAGVIDGVLKAPALREGGLLFAHLPLPHPPGSGGRHNLTADYLDNVRRAVAFLDVTLAAARQSGRPLRVVVFSDHPLRTTTWCPGSIVYAPSGCPRDVSLEDDQVPLMVAVSSGMNLPTLDAIRHNGQIFDVLTAVP